MRLPIGIFLAVAIVMPVLGDEVPFANPPARTSSVNDSYRMSLSDIMGFTQLRHIKLWFAAKAKNWELVKFEVAQLKDSFDKAAMLYMNIPIEYVVSVEKPLIAMREAANEKDTSKFVKGFVDLQKACNECHKAANISFVTIQTPIYNPFSDQIFAPTRK